MRVSFFSESYSARSAKKCSPSVLGPQSLSGSKSLQSPLYTAENTFSKTRWSAVIPPSLGTRIPTPWCRSCTPDSILFPLEALQVDYPEYCPRVCSQRESCQNNNPGTFRSFALPLLHLPVPHHTSRWRELAPGRPAVLLLPLPSVGPP